MPLYGSYSSRAEVTGLSRSWRSTSHAEQEEDLEHLVASSHALQAALRSAKAIISGTSQSKFAPYALQAVEVQSAAIDDVLHKMVETKYFNLQHNHSLTSATRFFDVAEICERVLMELCIADVLAMQRVNKRTLAIIEGSPKLQRKLHLASDLDAAPRALAFRPNGDQPCWREDVQNLRSLCMNFTPPFRSYVFGRGFGEPTVSIRLQPEDYLRQPPGARIRRMLLCQPPVTELEVELDCCGHTSMALEDYVQGEGRDSDGREADEIERLERVGSMLQKLRKEAGLTVGDVWDACMDLARAHELCPFAIPSDHYQDGFVKVGIRFYGGVHVRAKGEETKKKEQEDERRQKEIQHTYEASDDQSRRQEERNKHARLLATYIDYKQGAVSLSKPIPTFAEFQRMSVDATDRVLAAVGRDRFELY